MGLVPNYDKTVEALESKNQALKAVIHDLADETEALIKSKKEKETSDSFLYKTEVKTLKKK